MSIDQTALTYIIGLGTVFSFIFTWYNSIRKPQERGEVNDACFNERLTSLRETVVNLRDNHLHTIEEKLDKHIAENQRDCIETAKQMSKIETLLEEIIRKKNNEK